MCEAVSHRLRTRSCCGGCEQRPVSACSRQVGEQVVRRAAGNDNAGELRTRYAAVSPRPGMPCQCDGHPHTATDHCRPLASIPASPAENDVALSRHCAGCRPHPPIRGTEDLRSCCCALKARAEHRVIMLHAAVPSACCPAQKRRRRRRPRRSCAIQRCIRSEHTLDWAVEPFSGLRMAVFVCRVVAGGKGQKRQGCRRQCLRSSADGCVGMWAWFQVVWFVRLD